ncbi:MULTISPECIES: helix-turn-helix transcriptional regulator [Klebsiella]|uniref:helix-turn-helix transcriptional regulator n=1 Tax=Klebsiella TaxID=570 RepID=UPI000E2D85BC|nr:MULTISPECIES: helix-turn-helix domain-containing protein [Klebsiella]UHC87464.1 AlpA family phage regulatory protein [Klebsiella michiganensis]SWO60023.1 regulatory protein [Klebsiella pneumoniae]
MDTLPESGYMRPAQVMRHFQISESTLWKWVKNGKFPKPDRLSDGVTRFDVAELREWVKSRKTTSH